MRLVCQSMRAKLVGERGFTGSRERMGTDPMRQNLTLRILVSALALLVAAIHVGRPEVRIDSITIILLVICALPWLQPLIKSIELLGVKLELQVLQDQVAEARGAAESASRQAGLALSSSSAPPAALLSSVASGTADSMSIRALAGEYEQIRKAQRPGDARTAAMTDVVRRMIDVARRTESCGVADALRDDSPGTRLFAYVYLYSRPDAKFLLPLVESVTAKEDKPFGQYWGLQSIGRVMSGVAPVPLQVRNKLQAFGARLPRGTDRDYEVRKLLRQAG